MFCGVHNENNYDYSNDFDPFETNTPFSHITQSPKEYKPRIKRTYNKRPKKIIIPMTEPETYRPISPKSSFQCDTEWNMPISPISCNLNPTSPTEEQINSIIESPKFVLFL
jgi:hypothetical protein